ncbi:MAG: (2Fe-2S)-binding protein [Proteobacteria bacterium]|jgi:carbon-monoxide dehydrogenase small subunit|nr:(2Fe-2S)-binding protein [Pseudomonadota bacterium]
MKAVIRFRVNGREREILTAPARTLLEVLREDLRLTGTKQGCGEGECGTCTVLLDGAAVNACLVLAVEAAGREVTTIEGLADGPSLHPLQRAFVDHGAIQCGFCTPGMILSAKALLDRRPDPTEAEIREALGGNLCRCTGYQKIVEAVLAAARATAGGEGGAR